MARWTLAIPDIPSSLDPAFSASGLVRHPVTAAILSSRGYTDERSIREFLRPEYERDTHDPFLFSQMERVVERLARARAAGETVGIFGDFDADGVTSSVIIREAFTDVGLTTTVYLPDKLAEGHGFNEKALAAFHEAGAKLVVTLDCGMMNHAEVEAANALGIDVIIIDHHHVPEVLPAAFAIINPKLPEETYPFRELCGAGVSFKVAQALFQKLAPERIEQLKWLLDVVATGTVADVMPLVGENRVLVKYGLLVLSKTRRLGFQAMFRAGRLPVDEFRVPDARFVAFQIAPRINAASRMAHAQIAHDLLMSKDPAEAERLALELEGLNEARRAQSSETAESVRRIVLERFQEKKFIFAHAEEYPYGIVGLIAGRIANEFQRPTAILTKGPETSRGSLRGVPGFHLAEALEACSDLLEKHGGHAQAAGIMIKNENIDAFCERFTLLAEERLADLSLETELPADIEVLPEHLSPTLASELQLLAPFGEGNPEPTLIVRGMRVDDVRFVGNGEKHLKLRLSKDEGRAFDAIFFSIGDEHRDVASGDLVDVAFNLSENHWNGSSRLQLKVADLRPHSASGGR